MSLELYDYNANLKKWFLEASTEFSAKARANKKKVN